MSVATCATFCFIKFLYELEFCLLVTCDYHLCNALTLVYHEVLVGEVYEENAYLTTIVSVDGAGRVEHGDAMLEGESAARAYLCLISRRKSDIKSSRDELALKWTKGYWFLVVGTKIHTCTLWSGILWKWL